MTETNLKAETVIKLLSYEFSKNLKKKKVLK